MIENKTSRLERKIYEDPLTWGTPEMIRLAKIRVKAGLPAALPVSSNTGNEAAGKTTPSKATPSKAIASSGSEHTNLAKSKHQLVSTEASPYPKIRAKYDLLIEKVIASKNMSQRDKKAKLVNLEIRYESEIQEKKYQNNTLWILTGFVVLASFTWYAKISII